MSRLDIAIDAMRAELPPASNDDALLAAVIGEARPRRLAIRPVRLSFAAALAALALVAALRSIAFEQAPRSASVLQTADVPVDVRLGGDAEVRVEPRGEISLGAGNEIDVRRGTSNVKVKDERVRVTAPWMTVESDSADFSVSVEPDRTRIEVREGSARAELESGEHVIVSAGASLSAGTEETYRRAERAMARGDLAEAERLLLEIEAPAAAARNALLDLARVRERRGDREGAARAYREYLADPESPLADEARAALRRLE